MKYFIIILIIIAVICLLDLLLGFVFFKIALGPKRREDPKVPCKNSLFERNADNINLINGYKWFDETPHEEILIPSHEKGKHLHAQFFKNDSGSDLWAIVIHGWTNINREMSSYAMEYYNRGYNVIIPDLRGHGNSETKWVSMGWLDRLEIVDWTNYIVSEHPNAQIVLHGVSMGAATTMMATGEKLPPNVVCAVEDCGFSSVYQIFRDQSKDKYHIPPFISMPSASLVNRIFNGFSFKEASSVEQLKKSKTPTLFMHGDKDDFVKFENLDKVYNACAAEKEKYVVKGAEHAVSSHWFHEEYWNRVDQFLSKHVKPVVHNA
ncbi:MAG: alpha/beta hydrolase [Acutalibacteraceae bacterium]|nr:alpha/beta hydrolase [Oscillospiraceae bacterium]